MLKPDLLEIYQKNELIQKILHYLLIKCKKKKIKKSETLKSVSILSRFSFSLLHINNFVILTHFEVTLPQKNVCTRLYLKFMIELKCSFWKCILRILFFLGGGRGEYLKLTFIMFCLFKSFFKLLSTRVWWLTYFMLSMILWKFGILQ